MIGKIRLWAALACLGSLLCGAKLAAAAVAIDPLSVFGDAGDYNGVSVDISGDTLIVGGSAGGVNSKGWAQIFVRNEGVWQYEATLTTSDPALGANGQFGASVAIDGNTAVVGAPFGDAVYVFNRAGGQWVENESGRLKKPSGSQFGYDVDVSAGRILVGARAIDRAFIYAVGAGSSDPGIELPVASTRLNYGCSVALSGDLAVVGDSAANVVHFYSFSGTEWVEEAVVSPSQPSTPESFGLRVDLDGQRAVVGAEGMDLAGVSNVGAAYVYSRQMDMQTGAYSWDEEAMLVAPDGMTGDSFGSSVGVFANGVIVGARNAGPLGARAGAAYAFKCIDETWTDVGKVVPIDGGNNDGFGKSAALGSGGAVIGAWKHAGNTGEAYTVDLTFFPLEPGDANLDGEVDAEDAALLAAHWLTGEGAFWNDGDFNGDGAVDDLDASILAAHWGYGGGGGAAVPEPGAIALLVALAAWLLFKRGRRSSR